MGLFKVNTGLRDQGVCEFAVGLGIPYPGTQYQHLRDSQPIFQKQARPSGGFERDCPTSDH